MKRLLIVVITTCMIPLEHDCRGHVREKVRMQTLERAKVTATVTSAFGCSHLLRLLSSLYTFCSVYPAPASRMATSASAETALAEPSFNLQPVASPRLHQDVPERTCTPQHTLVQSVATPQRAGESPLAPKDLNSPGAGLLLIDVEPSHSRECTYPGRVRPCIRLTALASGHRHAKGTAATSHALGVRPLAPGSNTRHVQGAARHAAHPTGHAGHDSQEATTYSRLDAGRSERERDTRGGQAQCPSRVALPFAAIPSRTTDLAADDFVRQSFPRQCALLYYAAQGTRYPAQERYSGETDRADGGLVYLERDGD